MQTNDYRQISTIFENVGWMVALYGISTLVGYIQYDLLMNSVEGT